MLSLEILLSVPQLPWSLGKQSANNLGVGPPSSLFFPLSLTRDLGKRLNLVWEHGSTCIEDNPAGNPVLLKDSHGLGPLALYVEHVTWGGGNKCSWLSELLKVMLKGRGRSVERLEYCVL